MGLLGGVAAGENGRPSQHAPASRPETQPAVSPAKAPLQVVAFYSSTCYNCEKMRKTLKSCQDRWPKRIRVEHRDIRDLTLFVQMIAYNKHYGAKAQAPPKVFVGEQYLEDYPAIFKRLQTVIAEELAKGTTTFQPPPIVSADQEGGLTEKDAARAKLLRYFETFGPGAVAGAGLLDGVNPCAFTTIAVN